GRPPETAQTRLTADVIACPDGGARDAGTALCVANPSFEGTPGPGASNAPPWAGCATPITDRDAIWSASQSLPGQTWSSPEPTDGKTCLLMVTNGGAGLQATSEALCAPLHAGTTYSLEVDLASPSNTDGGLNTAGAVPASLQIFGGSTSCSQADLLWTSSAAPPTWTTFCASFTPSQDATYLTLAVTAPPDARNDPGYLYVDHVVPVASCP